jgi:hypothetical protein
LWINPNVTSSTRRDQFLPVMGHLNFANIV